ncbi:MAG: histidine phosphatase family protein [Lachnospiraceae bacterium]|nr:histidine phosphatase family protein [Lachnospiraceae bacterium]
MRIGLLRHFKVDCPHQKMMTSEEFREWSERYEVSGVLKNHVDMYGIEWDICYVSDLPRAVTTAKEVYSGNLFVDKLLREVDNAPFLHTERLRLPFELWHVCGRLAWLFRSRSQPETISGTRRRIRKFLGSIDWEKENILIVCHGFMIFNIQLELFRLRFMGTKLKKVRNGVLYQFNGRKPSEENLKRLKKGMPPQNGAAQRFRRNYIDLSEAGTVRGGVRS